MRDPGHGLRGHPQGMAGMGRIGDGTAVDETAVIGFVEIAGDIAHEQQARRRLPVRGHGRAAHGTLDTAGPMGSRSYLSRTTTRRSGPVPSLSV